MCHCIIIIIIIIIIQGARHWHTGATLLPVLGLVVLIQLPQSPSDADVGVGEERLSLVSRPKLLVRNDGGTVHVQEPCKQQGQPHAIHHEAQPTHCPHPEVGGV
jgi:hypothetical protein